MERVAEMHRDFNIGQTYGRALIDQEPQTPTLAELATEFRETVAMMTKATTDEDVQFWCGSALAYGQALAAAYDDAATLTDDELARLAFLKHRAQHGQIADVPPSA